MDEEEVALAVVNAKWPWHAVSPSNGERIRMRILQFFPPLKDPPPPQISPNLEGNMGQFSCKVHHHSTGEGYMLVSIDVRVQLGTTFVRSNNGSQGSADSILDISVLTCQAGTRAEIC